jgi:hypothetical protein
MKINVEKWIVRDKKSPVYDIISYRLISFEPCCRSTKKIPLLNIGYEAVENSDGLEDESGRVFGLLLKESYSWYDGEDTNEDFRFYLIKNCPCCGEKVEVNIVREVDKTDEYNQIKDEYEAIHSKWMKCDSKSKSAEYEKQWRVLNNKINSYYQTDGLFKGLEV